MNDFILHHKWTGGYLFLVQGVPEGSRQKKSFRLQAADCIRAYPPSPPPYIQLFALSFVVHLTLEIDSMSLSQNVWIAVLQSHKKLQDGSQKWYEKMDF